MIDKNNILVWAVIAIVILIFIFTIILAKMKKAQKKNKQPNETYQYQIRPKILTPNEADFFASLSQIAKSKNLHLFCKVRIADLIEPKKGCRNWSGAFAKIKSKHVDFVLCDPATLRPVLAIELDDSSHERADRKARDTFVDHAYKSAGLKILHAKDNIGLADKISASIGTKQTAVK